MRSAGAAEHASLELSKSRKQLNSQNPALAYIGPEWFLCEHNKPTGKITLEENLIDFSKKERTMKIYLKSIKAILDSL